MTYQPKPTSGNIKKMVNQQHFTLPEAAKLYQLDRSTLHKHATQGRGNDRLSVEKQTRRGKRVKVVSFSELRRFYGEPPQQAEEESAITAIEEQIEAAAYTARLEAQLESEKLLREQITADRDRAIEQADHWRKQFEQQNLLLTDERSKLEQAQAEKDRIVSELEETKSQPKRKWWQVWTRNN